MKVHQNAEGGVIASAREYDIAKTTKIYEGQVVTIAGGLVTAQGAAATTAILGVAAETHTGVADPFEPRNDGTKLKVYDAPYQIFRCPAPVVTATGGTATTIVATLAGAADAYNGGWLKLVKKAEDSTNPDAVGTMYRITDFATADGTGTFTKESGSVPSAGDEYALFMPFGFEGGNLSADGTKIVVTATASIPLRVVGRIEETNEICVIPAKHALGKKS